MVRTIQSKRKNTKLLLLKVKSTFYEIVVVLDISLGFQATF